MTRRLALVVDEKNPGEIRSIVEGLSNKKIDLYERSVLPFLQERGEVFCVFTNQPTQWNLAQAAHAEENEWVMAGFKGNRLLFAQKVEIVDTADFEDRLYGQVLWQLFSSEFANYSQGSVSAFPDLVRAGMMTFSSGGILLFLNDEMESLTGWTLRELAVKLPAQYIRVKDQMDAKNGGLHSLFIESRKLGILEFLFKDGRWHTLFFHSYVFPEPITGDDLLIILTGTHSSAESEEIMNRFDRMQERAILHDFRNLLQGVVTYTDLLGFEIVPGTVASGYLEKMRSELRRGQEVLRQLMYPVPVTESEMSLDQVLENLISTHREYIPQNISLKFTGNCPEPVALSAVDVGRIVRNLVKNAVEAIGTSPGEITIHTRPLSPTGVPGMEQNYVQLTISDTGPGIPEHLHDKIFEPFFTTREGLGGTGLGLYSVYTTVKQYGGQIYFESKPHKGTTFIIILPIAGK